MRRVTVLALLCLGVLGTSGIVYRWMFGGDHEPRASVPPPPPPPPPTPPPLRPPPAPIQEQAPAPPVVAFAVAEVAGVVEVRRDGAWRPLAAGDRVLVSDAVRTGEGAAAKLRTEGGAELALREKVELQVDELSETVAELTLARGKVKAEAGAGELSISTGNAAATGGSGSRFTVYADPRGAVAVASDVGDVKVVAGGRTVTLPAKKQTYVPPGGTPQDPFPIGDEVFLSVAWPKTDLTTARTTLRGKSEPGAIVKINGADVLVGDDGRFEAQVPLKEGPNLVRVQAESIGGVLKDVDRKVVVDSQGPPLNADPTKIFDTPPK